MEMNFQLNSHLDSFSKNNGKGKIFTSMVGISIKASTVASPVKLVQQNGRANGMYQKVHTSLRCEEQL